jgi:hypothetical protein
VSFPYINAYQQFFDSSGSPLASGTIEFRDPTTNDGAAASGLFLEDGVAYKVILKDSAGNTVVTHDDVRCPIISYLQTTAEDGAGVTPVDISYPPGDVRRYGFTGSTEPGDTTAVTNAVASGHSPIVFPSGTTWAPTTHVEFDSEADGLHFIGNGCTIDTAAIGVASPKQAKVKFENCDDVIFEGFNVTGDHDGVSGDDVAVLAFWSNTERCICRNNIIGGESVGTQSTHGLSFYSNNGEAHSNVIRWCNGFGIIIIRDSTLDGAIRIHHNLVDDCFRHFEPAYTTSNIEIDHNTSLNPAGASNNHLTVWAKPLDAEPTGTGTIKNVHFHHNLCIGGRDVAWVTCGETSVGDGLLVEGVYIEDNICLGVEHLLFMTADVPDATASEINNVVVERNKCTFADASVVTGRLALVVCLDAEYGYLSISDNIADGDVDLDQVINLDESPSATKTFTDTIDINGNIINTYGGTAGSIFFIDTATAHVNFNNNKLFDKQAGSYSHVLNINNSATATIKNNIGLDAITNTQNAVIQDNPDFVTFAKGSGEIVNGTTSDVITHGLDVTPFPYDINIALIEDPTNTPGAIWLSAVGATTFTVNCENDPGASSLSFQWKVDANR